MEWQTSGAAILVAIALIFVVAGFVKGAIGLGLPTVAMGLLGLLMPPAQAASLLIVPSFVTNVWQLAPAPRANGARAWALLRRLATMMIGVCAGTWSAQWLLAADALSAAHATIATTTHAATAYGTTAHAAVADAMARAATAYTAAADAVAAHATAAHAVAAQATPSATAALGLALAAYALVGLFARPWSVPRRHERWLSPLVGLTTGVVTGATGIFVMPAVPYLQALGFDRDDLMQALGLSFTVSTIALAIGLAQDGTFGLPAAGASLLTLAPALAGMRLGTWTRQRVSADRFRLAFFLGLLALGLHLWWRA